jgi:phage gp36-like protein
MFATRADLLARSNVRRLAQLAVPADYEFPVDEMLLRTAIEGGDVSGQPAQDQSSITLALAAIDHALDDADALLISYGVPAAAQTTLLARLSSTVALYYLQGAERMTQDVQDAYDAVLELLDKYRKGQLPGLVPADPDDENPGGEAWIESGRRRYR